MDWENVISREWQIMDWGNVILLITRCMHVLQTVLEILRNTGICQLSVDHP